MSSASGDQLTGALAGMSHSSTLSTTGGATYGVGSGGASIVAISAI